MEKSAANHTTHVEGPEFGGVGPMLCVPEQRFLCSQGVAVWRSLGWCHTEQIKGNALQAIASSLAFAPCPSEITMGRNSQSLQWLPFQLSPHRVWFQETGWNAVPSRTRTLTPWHGLPNFKRNLLFDGWCLREESEISSNPLWIKVTARKVLVKALQSTVRQMCVTLSN